MRGIGCVGIGLGVLAIILCVAYILAAPLFEMDVMKQVIYFPNAQYFFFALGVLLIFWGVSIGRKEKMQSWARVAGAMLSGLAALYVLAFLLVVFWLDEVSEIRWWIALIGLVIVSAFVYMAYYLLLKKETLWAFAKQYYDKDDFDQPPRPREKSQGISVPREPVPQNEEAPELARLIPAGGDGQPFVMRESRITIGRQSCSLLLDPDDTSTSRQHATISLIGEQFVLEDKSRNGTTVNGQLIKNAKLTLPDGAAILFGHRDAKFVFERAQVEKTPPQEATADADKAPTVLARLEPLWPEGKPFDIVKPQVIIGRDPVECDLTLPLQEDLTISGKHAAIECTGQGEFILRDLSSNGTYVDNVKISEIELMDGVEIRLGLKNTRFRFRKG